MKQNKVKISDIFKKIGGFSQIILELSYKEKNKIVPTKKQVRISISLEKFFEKIEDLIKGKEEKICLAHGMTDIDIFKVGKDFCLMVSVSPGLDDYYFISEKEFLNMRKFIHYELQALS